MQTILSYNNILPAAHKVRWSTWEEKNWPFRSHTWGAYAIQEAVGWASPHCYFIYSTTGTDISRHEATSSYFFPSLSTFSIDSMGVQLILLLSRNYGGGRPASTGLTACVLEYQLHLSPTDVQTKFQNPINSSPHWLPRKIQRSDPWKHNVALYPTNLSQQDTTVCKASVSNQCQRHQCQRWHQCHQLVRYMSPKHLTGHRG